MNIELKNKLNTIFEENIRLWREYDRETNNQRRNDINNRIQNNLKEFYSLTTLL